MKSDEGRKAKKAIMDKRLWSLLLTVLLFSSCSYEYPTLEKTMARQWKLIAIVQESDTTAVSPQILLLRDSSLFSLANQKGTWQLHDSTITFSQGNSTIAANTPYGIRNISATKLELMDREQVLLFEFVPQARTTATILYDVFRGILGIIILLIVAVLFSNNRRKIDWRLVATGIGLQVVFALAVLKVEAVKAVFDFISSGFVIVLTFTLHGADFLFGKLVTDVNSFGYIFAFQVLPTIIFFSALTSLFYYLNILQYVVMAFAWIMKKTMRLSGAESLAAAANIFVGQTEAPLVVKPYVDKMTRSEIMALMTGGMATIAGGVLAAFIGFLGGTDPVARQIFATHLLTASIMSAPAALLIAKIMIPETEVVNRDLNISKEKMGKNVLDAISNGTTQGLKLAVNVGAMLLVFLAFVAMFDYIFLHGIGEPTGLNQVIRESTNGYYEGFSFRYILGHLFAPFAWIMGVPAQDLTSVGRLLGEKTLFNEFVAYVSLGNLKDTAMLTNEKSIIIATYALCGFANFASIGIQIGGIGVIAPHRKTMLSELGLRALVGGTLACFLTAAIAGMLV
ncbi:MAG: nucleoside transporter C-terminal domain-containing protein [Bacteroidia bacterium]